MKKDTYHHDNLKEDLIEKGLTLLNEEGYENFSLRKVAKMCGVSHTAPYRHFKNKDELIIAITLEISKKFDDALKEAIKIYPDDIEKQINEMGFQYVKFFVKNPDYLQLLFLSDLDKHLDINNVDISLKDFQSPFNTLLSSIDKIPNKESNNSLSFDRDAYALSCWSRVHGLAVLIAKKQYYYEGDCLELARKIIWNTHMSL